MTAGLLIVVVVFVFLVFGFALSKRQSQTKKEAIESLQREKEALAPVSIQTLAEEEAAELGLAQIHGSEGIPTVILLKVWRSSADVIARCSSRDQLRYQVRPGVDAALATEPDVTLVCDGELAPPQPEASNVTDDDDEDFSEHEVEE